MPNKFEAWKHGLTLEKFIEMFSENCDDCPLFEYCTQDKGCDELIKEWGEQDAE